MGCLANYGLCSVSSHNKFRLKWRNKRSRCSFSILTHEFIVEFCTFNDWPSVSWTLSSGWGDVQSMLSLNDSPNALYERDFTVHRRLFSSTWCARNKYTWLGFTIFVYRLNRGWREELNRRKLLHTFKEGRCDHPIFYNKAKIPFTDLVEVSERIK